MATSKEGATAATEDKKKDKGPSPILRGVSGGKATIALWVSAPTSKAPMQGYVAGPDGKHMYVNGFINTNGATGRPFISLSTFVPGKSADGTKDSWKEVATGNAMNQRRDGEPLYFDTVVFKVDGKVVGARLTKAGDEYAKQLGFDNPRVERPKAAANADTDAEAAAAVRPRARG